MTMEALKFMIETLEAAIKNAEPATYGGVQGRKAVDRVIAGLKNKSLFHEGGSRSWNIADLAGNKAFDPQMPLAKLGLGSRLRNLLGRKDICVIADLTGRTDEDYLDMTGLGVISMDELHDKLQHYMETNLL